MKQVIKILILVFWAFLANGKVWASEFKYPNGAFTNIYGCGERIYNSPPSCHNGRFCDLSSSCNKGSLPSGSVFRYECDGMTTQCVLNETNGDSASVGNPGCGKTVQIDVFDHNCREGGAGTWNCGLPVDYFVYYTGDCPSTTPILCNTNEVTMAVSPNPVRADNRDVHFQITSGDASTWVGNSWTGGVANCNQSNWNDVVCKSTAAGSFNWTHSWRVCQGVVTNCSDLCTKSVGYRVDGAGGSPAILLGRSQRWSNTLPVNCRTSSEIVYVVGNVCGRQEAGNGYLCEGWTSNENYTITWWQDKNNDGDTTDSDESASQTNYECYSKLARYTFERDGDNRNPIGTREGRWIDAKIKFDDPNIQVNTVTLQVMTGDRRTYNDEYKRYFDPASEVTVRVPVYRDGEYKWNMLGFNYEPMAVPAMNETCLYPAGSQQVRLEWAPATLNTLKAEKYHVKITEGANTVTEADVLPIDPNGSSNITYTATVRGGVDYSWEVQPIMRGETPFMGQYGSSKTTRNFRCSPVRVLNPKSCTVAVGAVLPVGEPVAITASGRGNMGVAEGRSETAGLWLESVNGRAINPLPAEVIRTVVSAVGNIYYQINQCTSANDQPCNLSKSVNGLGPGAYFVHCDLPTEPQPPVSPGNGRCSGNPFCPLGLVPSLAAGDARATARREGCGNWVYCNAVGRQDRDYFVVTDAGPAGIGITIRNSGDATVSPEVVLGENRNHICQTVFRSGTPLLHDRRVKFVVVVADSSGGDTINTVRMRLQRGGVTLMQANGVGLTTATPTYSVTGGGVSLYQAAVKSVSGNRLTIIFSIQFPAVFSGLAGDSLQILAEDEIGQSSGWMDGGRKFKVWDCQVPTEGTVYDGSGAPLGPVCSIGDGYSTAVGSGVFTDLTYTNLTSGDKTMTKRGDAGYFGSGTNSLIWGGGSYGAVFNGGSGLPGSAPIARLVDKNKLPSVPICPGPVMSMDLVDAYQDNPEAVIDFSLALSQAPWYQTVSGGRLGRSSVTSMVPPTCLSPGCTPALSVQSSPGTNGIVAAGGAITSGSGCSSCKKGDPNDWYKENENITDGSISYAGLKGEYYDRKGMGVIAGGGNWSSVKSAATSGVIFVDGNLTIDEDFSLPGGSFMMLVVKGAVSVLPGVVRFDGVIVADGNVIIGASGDPAAVQLVINGSIYSRGGLIVRRTLALGENNTNPAVVIRYRPDFVFLMPAKLTENVYNWREGN